jgi:hypothetical protein
LHLTLSLPQPKLVAPSILLFILAVYLVLSISLDSKMKQKVDKTGELQYVHTVDFMNQPLGDSWACGTRCADAHNQNKTKQPSYSSRSS